MHVHFTNLEIYRYDMMLHTGPNQCFLLGADGNDHAIFITPQSDDSGPHTPDAIVDCRLCGCEQVAGIRFTCEENGRCTPCDPCAQTECRTGEICVRDTCTQTRCVCDALTCSGTTCDERITVANECRSERCVTTRACIEGSCEAECSDGDITVRTYCEESVLMREVVTCGPGCLRSPRTTALEDCSLAQCPLGTIPVCSEGGCRCN